MRGASLSWVVVVLWCGCDPDRVVDVGDPRRLIISAPRVMLDDGSQVDVRATLEGTQVEGRPLYLRNGAVFEGQPDPLQSVFGSPGDNDLQHGTACSPVDWIAPSPDGRWAYACGVGEVFEGTARLASAGWLATMAPDGVWLGGEVNVQMSNSFVPYRALRVAPQGGLYFHLEYQSTRSHTGVPVGTYAELPGEPNPLATDYDRVLLASDLSVYAASARTGTVWRLPLEPGVASVVYVQSAVPADVAHDVLNVAVDNRATLITAP